MNTKVERPYRSPHLAASRRLLRVLALLLLVLGALLLFGQMTQDRVWEKTVPFIQAYNEWVLGRNHQKPGTYDYKSIERWHKVEKAFKELDDEVKAEGK